MRARYYAPEIGRFLSQDTVIGDIANSQSLNRYAYCGGNPVVYVDPNGEVGILATVLIGAGVGALVSGGLELISQIRSGEEIDWRHVGISAASGALSGALAGTGMGTAGLMAGNALLGAGESVAHDIIEKKDNNEMVRNAIISGGLSAIGTKIGDIVSAPFQRATYGEKLIDFKFGRSLKVSASPRIEARVIAINTLNGIGIDFGLGMIQNTSANIILNGLDRKKLEK